jgi:predicted nucleotidyltransferase
MKLQELRREILDSILRGYDGDAEGVVLFGSTGRGEMSSKSDVDILIFTKDAEENRIKRDLRAYLALEPVRAKYEVDTTVVTLKIDEVRDVTPFLINVAHDSVVLLDPHGRVSKLLDRIREAVERAGFIRYKIGDAYGWKSRRPLKPGENVTIELDSDANS